MVGTVLSCLLSVLLVGLAVPTLVLWRQVRAARRTPAALPESLDGLAPRPPIAVLVPAHDEAR